jgi:hypothetical protein
MVHRRFWLKLLERAWKERSVVWLAGVRSAQAGNDTGSLVLIRGAVEDSE